MPCRNMNFSYRMLLFVIIPGLVILTSCKSTKETTIAEEPQAPPATQLQNWQERQNEMDENRESSGLNQDVIRKLEDYADRKAVIVCKMKEFSALEQQSLSETESADLKARMNALDAELAPLDSEIAAYCDTRRKRDYFEQVLKHKLRQCQ